MRQLISNAFIVTGDLDREPFLGDVFLERETVTHLGRIPVSQKRSADVRIDAGGKVLAPGFVDTHNHGALGGTRTGPAGLPLACELALRAGVTKRICGVDGLSPAPVAADQRADYADQLKPLDGAIDEPWCWSRVAEFLQWYRGRAVTDMGLYLGHGAVRRYVMGNRPGPADAEALRQMRALVRAEAPETLGLSTGLVYNPAVYSDQHEIEALLSAFAEVQPAKFFPHLRSESDGILESLSECLNACIRTGAGYCNEHSKIAGKKNYQKMAALEARLADGAASVESMANMYPYTAGSTTGDALFPPEFRSSSRAQFLGLLQDRTVRTRIYEKIKSDTHSWDNFIGFCGGLEGIRIAGAPYTPGFLGQTLAQVARAAGAEDPASAAAFEAVFDFFAANRLEVSIISHYGSELIMERFFRRPDMAVCTDGLMPGPGQKPHPRCLGAFPKALRLAREMGIPPRQIMWRLSVLPCRFLGLESPVIRPGADASLVLFDWDRVTECNDYQHPLTPPQGIHKVWVHGRLAMDEGRFPVARPYPGRILQRVSRPREA